MTSKREKQTLTDKALAIFISHYFSLDWIRFLYYVKVHTNNQSQIVAAADAIRVLTMMRGNNVCAKGLIVVNLCVDLLCGELIEDFKRYQEIMTDLRLNHIIIHAPLGIFGTTRRNSVSNNETKKVKEQAIQNLEKERERYFESQMQVWNKWKENDRQRDRMMYDMWREMLLGSFKQPFYLAAEAFELSKKGGYIGEIFRKAGEMFIDGAREMMSNGRVIANDNWKMYYDAQENKMCENESLVSGSELLTLARSIDAAYQMARHQHRRYSYLLKEERTKRMKENTMEGYESSFSLMTAMVSLNSKAIEKLTSASQRFGSIELNTTRISSICSTAKSIAQDIFMREKELQDILQGLLSFDEYTIAKGISHNLIENWKDQATRHVRELQEDLSDDLLLSSEYDGYWEFNSIFSNYSNRLITFLRSWQQEVNDVRKEAEESRYCSWSYYDREVFELRQMRLSYISGYFKLECEKRIKANEFWNIPFPQTYYSSTLSSDRKYTRKQPILFSTLSQQSEPNLTYSLLTSALRMSYWLRSNEQKLVKIKERVTKTALLGTLQMNQRQELLLLIEGLYEYSIIFVRACFERRASPSPGEYNKFEEISRSYKEGKEITLNCWIFTKGYNKELIKHFEFFKGLIYGIDAVNELYWDNDVTNQDFFDCISSFCFSYQFIILQQLLPSSSSSSSSSIPRNSMIHRIYLNYLQSLEKKKKNELLIRFFPRVSNYCQPLLHCFIESIYFRLIKDHKKEEDEQLKIELLESFYNKNDDWIFEIMIFTYLDYYYIDSITSPIFF